MAATGFRYPYDILATLEPWREKLGSEFDSVAARLTDRDRSLEDYVNQVIYDRVTSLITLGGGETIGPLGAWTTFTPTLTADGGGVALGTGGFVEGHYTRIGRTIIGWANVKFGTAGAAAGAGFYRVAAPAAGISATIGNQTVGPCWHIDDSAGNFITGNVFMDSGASVFTFISEGGGVALISNSFPWVWANNDSLRFSFCYEAAS